MPTAKLPTVRNSRREEKHQEGAFSRPPASAEGFDRAWERLASILVADFKEYRRGRELCPEGIPTVEGFPKKRETRAA